MLVMAPRVVPESRAQGPQARLDVEGAFTITIGLALFVYGIVGTDTHSWGSTQTVMALLGGLAFLVAALFIEARVAEQPLVPLGIFGRRPLCAANAIALTVGAGLFGMYFFISLYLQQVVGFSPLRTGLAVLPAGTMSLAGALVAPRLVAVLGAKRQLMVGPALSGAGLLWMSLLSFGDGYWAHMFGPLVLFGLGIGLSFVPMTLTATAGVPPKEAGLASGLINTTRQMGGALGLAVLATLAAGTTRDSRAAGHSIEEALTSGYDKAFLIAGLLLLVGAGLAVFIGSGSSAPSGAPGGNRSPASSADHLRTDPSGPNRSVSAAAGQDAPVGGDAPRGGISGAATVAEPRIR
jgi:predicted MFS family arabinose efflux permease